MERTEVVEDRLHPGMPSGVKIGLGDFVAHFVGCASSLQAMV